MLGGTKDLHHLWTKGARHPMGEIEFLVQKEFSTALSLMSPIILRRLGTHTHSWCTAELQVKHRNRPCLSLHVVYLALTSDTVQHANPSDISALLIGQEHSISSKQI